MTRLTLTTFCILIGKICFAQNPFIVNIYTADPSARVFDDNLYLYLSHDEGDATSFSMKDWHVFSTFDMKKWTDYAFAFPLKILAGQIKMLGHPIVSNGMENTIFINL